MPEFHGKKVTDERLLGSGNAAKWRSLTLSRTQVTDNGIIQLCGMATKLEEVHIASDLISDAAMPALCSLANLRSLLFEAAPHVTDEGIAHITRLSHLRELYLKRTQLTDAGIDAVLKCQDVWSLVLDRTQITDRGVLRLGALPGLKLVSLNGIQIDGSGLRGLPNADRLYLYVADCPITDRNLLEFLRGHDRIEIVRLNNTQISDESIPALAQLPGIADLGLEGTAVTDAGIVHLLGHPALRRLYLRQTAVSDEMVQQLKAKSPQRLSLYTNIIV